MDSGITRYAPIFWFHEYESYLPIEVKAIVENADLYKKGKKVPFERSLEDLVGLEKNGKDYWLEIPDLDLGLSKTNNYIIKSKKGYGLTYVAEAIKERFTSIQNNYKKVIYARHGNFDINQDDFNANVWSGRWKIKQDVLIGHYDVYQYFPFYFFNDFTNLHIGDWDSTVEIFHNNTKNIFWMRTHAHHFAWLTKMVRLNHYTNLNNWLQTWRNYKEGLCDIFNLNRHPFIFVSKGGHGCYPTPGYSVRGIGQIDLPIAFEERDIGKTCFIPKPENTGGTSETQIKDVLNRASIKTDKLQCIEYELVDFDSEIWSKFKGRWGNRSDYKTWDSPVSAPNKREFKISKYSFINNFNKEYQKRYKTELIFYNYHGLLENQA